MQHDAMQQEETMVDGQVEDGDNNIQEEVDAAAMSAVQENDDASILASENDTSQQNMNDPAHAIAAASALYTAPASPPTLPVNNNQDNLLNQARAAAANGWIGSATSTQVQPAEQQHLDQHQQNKNGRKSLDILLEEQKQAANELQSAEEEYARAKERLEKAKHTKMSIEKSIENESAALEALDDNEELVNMDTKWNSMYKKLMAFKREHGHCQVMQNQRSGGKRKQDKELSTLGSWVGQVRRDYKRPMDDKNRLEPYKIAALDRQGFDWEPRESYWNDMYEQLKVYLQNNGGRMPPRFINNQKHALGQWCDTQLDNYRKLKSGKKGAYITQEKVDLLNQIGFIWDKRGQLWKDNYEKLKLFKAQYGHANANATNTGDKSFGTWISKQKRKYSNYVIGEEKSLEYTLTDEQYNLLNEVGFSDCVVIGGRKAKSKMGNSIEGLVNASQELFDQDNQQQQQQELGGEATNLDPSAAPLATHPV